MLPNEAPRTKNTADTIYVLTVSRGLAAPRTREFRTGEPQDAHSVGSAGDWEIRGPGVEPVHAYLYFDGEQLYLQSALEGRSVLVGGEPVGTDWRPVPMSAVIELGTARIMLSQREGFDAAAPAPVIVHSGDYDAITGEERTAFVSLEAPAAPNFSGALHASSFDDDDEKTRFPAPQRPVLERAPLDDDEKTRFPALQRPLDDDDRAARLPTLLQQPAVAPVAEPDWEATRMYVPDRSAERRAPPPAPGAVAGDAYDELQEPTQAGKSRLMTAAPHTPTGAVPLLADPLAPTGAAMRSGVSPARRPVDPRVTDESTRLAAQPDPSRLRQPSPPREIHVPIQDPHAPREPSQIGARTGERPRIPEDRPSRRPSGRPPEDRPSKAPPRAKRSSSRDVNQDARAKPAADPAEMTRVGGPARPAPDPGEMTRVGEPGMAAPIGPLGVPPLGAPVPPLGAPVPPADPALEQKRRGQKTARVRGPDGSGGYQPPPPPMALPLQEQPKAPKPPSAIKRAFDRFAQHFEEVNRVRKTLYLSSPFVLLAAIYLLFVPPEPKVSSQPNVTTADPPPDAGPAPVESIEPLARPVASEAPVAPSYPVPPPEFAGTPSKPIKGKTRERQAADAYEAGRYPEALGLYREMATDPEIDPVRQRIFLDIIRIIELKLNRGPRERIEPPPLPPSVR